MKREDEIICEVTDAELEAETLAIRLLEALQSLLAMVVEGECNYDDQGREWPEVIQARAAIEEAEGVR